MDLETLQKNRSTQAFELSDENIKDITEGIEKAGESETPFPVTDEKGELKVIGDATQIQRDVQTYKIMLMLDKKEFSKQEAEELNINKSLKEINTMYLPEIVREFRAISPSKRTMINSAFIKFITYFSKVENGKLIFLTDEELTKDIELRLYMDSLAMDAIHESVNEILSIPEEFKDKVQSASAVKVVVEFIFNNPDLINEIYANFN